MSVVGSKYQFAFHHLILFLTGLFNTYRHYKLGDTQSEGTECQCNKTLLHTKLNLIPVTFYLLYLAYFYGVQR